MRQITLSILALAVLICGLSAPFRPPSEEDRRIDIKTYEYPVLSLYGLESNNTFQYARIIEKWYKLPSSLLCAWIYWESGGSLDARNTNRNGTHDDGPLQYNSQYIGYYALAFNGGEYFNPNSIYSIQVGARELSRNHVKTWKEAIQLHNNGEKKYSDRVWNVYRMFSQF